jgi:hypothetical protein
MQKQAVAKEQTSVQPQMLIVKCDQPKIPGVQPIYDLLRIVPLRPRQESLHKDGSDSASLKQGRPSLEHSKIVAFRVNFQEIYS